MWKEKDKQKKVKEQIIGKEKINDKLKKNYNH